MNIDFNSIQQELQNLAGSQKVKVKVCQNGAKVAVRETDGRIDVRLNSKKIRTPKQLEAQLGWLRVWVGG